MAQKVHVVLYDDLTGDEITHGGTVTFGYDGTDYEIDLNDYHADQFLTMLEPYMNVARLVTPKPRRGPARTADSRKLRASMRQWGIDHGYKIKARGRIPADVARAYEAAH